MVKRVLALAALLCLTAMCARAMSIAGARRKILAQTMPYLNVPYLWGGVHPKTGLDCSAFVQLVFRNAGLNLPRVSSQQYEATRLVRPRSVLPGDLVFFSMEHPGLDKVDHVGIYLGKGLFIHASVTNGVHVEAISKPYYMDRLVAIHRFAGF